MGKNSLIIIFTTMYQTAPFMLNSGPERIKAEECCFVELGGQIVDWIG